MKYVFFSRLVEVIYKSLGLGTGNFVRRGSVNIFAYNIRVYNIAYNLTSSKMEKTRICT